MGMMIEYLAGIDCIPPEIRILRVFSRNKYEKLLKDRAIWFSNIDILRANCDELERTIPESFFSRMNVLQADFYKRCNAAKDNIYKSFVSCWSKTESQKLWQTYDRDANGFAVVSTVGRLSDAFRSSCVFPCEVQYVDLDDPNLRLYLPWIIVKDDQLGISTAMRLKEQYKAGEFIDDDEIRFICFERANIDNEKGINICVDLSDIIEYAIVNPYSSEADVERSLSILQSNGIRIAPSKLSDL